MSNITINSLPTAVSIDGVQDILPIYTNSATATQGINRNTLLGLASAPVGLTDTQTLTNKVLTTPTINGATLSGTLSGTYTIGGTPTFPNTVVSTTGSQTLTNKVLTSPTITNASLTADAITGFSSANTGSIYGISVTSGTINSAAITSASIADSLITPRMLLTGTGTSWVWQSYSPTWGNISIGNGTNASYYIQIGKTVYVRAYITFGSTTTIGTGSITFTLPVTAKSGVYTTKQLLGTSLAVGSSLEYPGVVEYNTTTSVLCWGQTIASSTPVLITYSSTAPFTWTTNNAFSANIVYEAA